MIHTHEDERDWYQEHKDEHAMGYVDKYGNPIDPEPPADHGNQAATRSEEYSSEPPLADAPLEWFPMSNNQRHI
ncbi:hypothetical protein [Streptomyces albireticuli]|uniref:Uncharacterized protein n=1 Tax=Streptomyces albireticuli TaxID=1940 RepID=A0A2A2D566_9ACTN|nr:hypothetical protein [Streptomyces albireticuli]MCD9194235.1 hypothetical protein [Streptomyces albireticuli]PAU46586.1 hypothetical protein CK936_23325 [Streptomyces albireticuli]